MNMLVFDPIREMSHDILRVSPNFTIPPKLYKMSEAVVRLVRGGFIGRRKATPE